MTTSRITRRADSMSAWAYDELLEDAPSWVRATCRRNDAGELVVDRSTGAQVVEPGEVLIKDADSRDLLWCTASMFERDYRGCL